MDHENSQPHPSEIAMQDKEQLSLLKSFMESSTDYSIIEIDLNGNIIAWNEGAKRLYCYDIAEILGKSHDALYHSDDIQSGKINKIFNTVLQKEKWSGVLRCVNKKAQYFNVFATITLLKDINNITGFILISRDLSELEHVLKILLIFPDWISSE